jgi:predicted RNase H-like nuclease (RuvC/YqgF family)
MVNFRKKIEGLEAKVKRLEIENRMLEEHYRQKISEWEKCAAMLEEDLRSLQERQNGQKPFTDPYQYGSMKARPYNF